MYSLDCNYFHNEFHTIPGLVDHVLQAGMDPNYEITKDGEKTGELLTEYIVL